MPLARVGGIRGSGWSLLAMAPAAGQRQEQFSSRADIGTRGGHAAGVLPGPKGRAEPGHNGLPHNIRKDTIPHRTTHVVPQGRSVSAHLAAFLVEPGSAAAFRGNRANGPGTTPGKWRFPTHSVARRFAPGSFCGNTVLPGWWSGPT